MKRRRSRDGPHPVDIHVGRQMRLRRVLLGLSQQRLADCLGLSFQQVQKYEKGANRLSASRLHDLARLLDVPVSYFFDELSPSAADRRESKGVHAPPHGRSGAACGSARELAFNPKRETLELVRAYYRIKSRHVRNRLLELIKKLADAEASAPAETQHPAVTVRRR